MFLPALWLALPAAATRGPKYFGVPELPARAVHTLHPCSRSIHNCSQRLGPDERLTRPIVCLPPPTDGIHIIILSLELSGIGATSEMARWSLQLTVRRVGTEAETLEENAHSRTTADPLSLQR